MWIEGIKKKEWKKKGKIYWKNEVNSFTGRKEWNEQGMERESKRKRRNKKKKE